MISWLPSAHVAERNAHHYLPIVYGLQITCCEDPRQVLSYLPEVRPSWFFAVPRIWEKLKAGLETMLASPARGAAGEGARRRSTRRCARCAWSRPAKPVPPELAEQVAARRRGDLRRTAHDARTRPGRGDQRRRGADAGRGARVLPRDRPAARRAVGDERDLRRRHASTRPTRSGSAPSDRPRPACEIKLDTDGEVLIRSDVVMNGYRNLPEKTAESFTEDGFLRTGDIGEFDEDGLPEDRRPQEGADHQRRRQEHVTGEHRGDAEDRLAADRAGVLHRRPSPLQHGADRARRRLRADVGGPAGHRGHLAGGAGERRAHARRGVRGRRRGQREAGQSRTGQEVHGRRRRLAARRRRADADDEAQAQADRREVRARRSSRCTRVSPRSERTPPRTRFQAGAPGRRGGIRRPEAPRAGGGAARHCRAAPRSLAGPIFSVFPSAASRIWTPTCRASPRSPRSSRPCCGPLRRAAPPAGSRAECSGRSSWPRARRTCRLRA